MGRDERGAAALARALRDHLSWDDTDRLGLPELSADDLAGARRRAQAGAGAAADAALGDAGTVSGHPEVEAPPPAAQPTAAAHVHVAEGESVSASTAAAPAHAPAEPDRAADAPSEDPRTRLVQLEEQVRTCTRCELARGRTQTVFARGNPAADLVFVGEGPGRDEDQQGAPFVGAAGKLLDKMIAAMKRSEQDVYICNVVKCRPPQNRTPLPQEAGACRPYLDAQLDAVAPRVIVALGRCAADNLGCVPPSGGRWRGRWGNYRGVPVMPTYHPAFLLRSPEFKRPVWEDLQQVMQRLR